MSLNDFERLILQQHRVPYQVRYAIETMDDRAKRAIYTLAEDMRLTRQAECRTVAWLKTLPLNNERYKEILSRLNTQNFYIIGQNFAKSQYRNDTADETKIWNDAIESYLKTASLLN